MTLTEDSRRGAEARRLMAEPLLAQAFAAVEDGLKAAWLATQDGETDERERLWLSLRLLRRLRAELEAAAAGGRLADRQLEKT